MSQYCSDAVRHASDPSLNNVHRPLKAGACKVCTSLAGYGRVFGQLDQCRNCGFITFRDYDPEVVSAIYDTAYFAGSEYPDYLGQQDALRKSMRGHLKQMARYKPDCGSLVEIGCAYGLFLDEAKFAFGEAVGVDICESPIAYAWNVLGLDVYCGYLPEIDFGGRRFDVVCLWDTIEHLSAPDAYIEKISRILKPGGLLFLTTADINSFNARLRGSKWRQIHPPTHLHYFSKSTITRLLGRLSFEVEGIETASYYHTIFNILRSIEIHGGVRGRVAATALRVIGQSLARRIGFWINLGDILFVAARLNKRISN